MNKKNVNKYDLLDFQVEIGSFVEVLSLSYQKGIENLSEGISGKRVVWQYLTKYPFVIISAYRRTFTKAENSRRLKELVRRFREQTGIGAFMLKGVGQEINRKTGEVEEAKEWSALFVLRPDRKYRIKTFDELLKIAKEFALEYDQDYILYGDGGGVYYLAKREGNDYHISEKYNHIKEGIAEYYSVLKGYRFYLTEAKIYVYGKPIVNTFQGMAYGRYVNIISLKPFLDD